MPKTRRKPKPAVAGGLLRGRRTPPVRPAPPDRDWPHPWQANFLRSLTLIPGVSSACRAAGVDRSWAYKCRDADAEFAAAWDEALDICRDNVERYAHAWITNGVPVKTARKKTVSRLNAKTRNLEIVSEESYETEGAERSATLMIFWLKAWYPDRYRWSERLEATGADGGPIRIASLSEIDRAIEQLTAEIEARAADGEATGVRSDS